MKYAAAWSACLAARVVNVFIAQVSNSWREAARPGGLPIRKCHRAETSAVVASAPRFHRDRFWEGDSRSGKVRPGYFASLGRSREVDPALPVIPRFAGEGRGTTSDLADSPGTRRIRVSVLPPCRTRLPLHSSRRELGSAVAERARAV